MCDRSFLAPGELGPMDGSENPTPPELRHLAWHDLLDQGGVSEAGEFRVTNR